MDTSDLLSRAKAKLEAEITEIESRKDISDDDKVQRILVIFASVCAGVAVQPIPFADIFVLTPIQAYMGTRISSIRGIPLNEKDAGDILKEISGVVGLGMIAQQIALGLYKVGLPFLAGITTIPLVFGLTYAVGKVMDTYFIQAAKGKRMNPEDIRREWDRAREEGKREAKRRPREVRDVSI